MINRNTDSKAVYLLSNAFWMLFFMFNYRALLFLPLNGLTEETSKLILWVVGTAFATIGIALTFKQRRNDTSTLANTLMPFELYAIVTYYRFFPTAVICFSVVSVVLAIVYFCAVLMQRESKSTGNTVRLPKSLRQGLLGGRTIVAVCLMFFVAFLAISSISGHDLYKSDVEPVVSTPENTEWTVNNKIDTVKLLKEDSWSQLDVQEKLDVLGTIVNIEVRYLGINHPITLKSGILEESSLSHYEPKNNCIVISLTHLADSKANEALNSICHECYHAYQHSQVEVYSIIPEEYKNMIMFNDVGDYEKEFNDYEDGSDDITKYFLQKSETNARKYASASVDSYYQLIEQYTIKENT